MHPARIAELLQPFLSVTPNPCHSEQGQRPDEEPTVLSPTQLQDISKTNSMIFPCKHIIRPTAIRDPKKIPPRHFGESLFAARHLFPTPASQGKTEKNSSAPSAPALSKAEGCSAVKGLARVADLGSGAGFPGVPIKLWAPNIALTLIESN